MLIRYGYEMAIVCPAPTPIVTQLDVHPGRASSVRRETPFTTVPDVEASAYIDMFGNLCRRFVAPSGRLLMSCHGVIEDDGKPDPIVPDAPETPVAQLPDECLTYLLGSRYCETDKLSQIAWNLFGTTPTGWPRVQAICDFVHSHLTFGYQYARDTRTAYEAYSERIGVCRDFAHLAVTFCRCMNIPARYANGYLGDIEVEPDPSPMDFNAWFEVFLGGRWYTFDARHNTPRVGRILVSRGRDAADIPLLNSFGPHQLESFKVLTEEMTLNSAMAGV
jgi:transglutaminase-like putative cysteine protease